MQFKNITYEKKDYIATLTLNRPHKMNALSLDTLKEIIVALDDADIDDDTRVVIVTGAGRAFCAGDDLEGFEGINVASGRIFAKEYMAMVLKLEKIGKPVIAAINGVTMGGGVELSLACDLAIAAEDVKFTLPEIRVGAWPGFAVTRLPDIVGHRKARELMLTSDTIDAKEAERIGLINKAVPADQLGAAVKTMADKIAAMSPRSVIMTKASYNGTVGGRELAYSVTHPIMVFTSEDFQEGVDAAIHKRKPNFTKKK